MVLNLKTHWPVVSVHGLGLLKHTALYCLLSFETLSFLGFNKTPGFSNPPTIFLGLLLFLNCLNMNFFKVQSLVFCFFFVFRKCTHSRGLMTFPILLPPALTFVLSFSPCAYYQKKYLALARWLGWLEHCPVYQRVVVQFPVWEHT